jgi:hypothetical protein
MMSIIRITLLSLGSIWCAIAMVIAIVGLFKAAILLLKGE